jgi:hypothetical protein
MKYLALPSAATLRELRSLLATALFATVLFGCGKTPPTCIDEPTITLVKQVVANALEKDLVDAGKDAALVDRLKQRIQIAVTTIRTSNKDEKIGKVTCDASLEITLAKADQIVGDPVFKSLQDTHQIPASIETKGAAWKTDIQYTAQRTEDTNHLLVELSRHAPMVRLLSTLAQAGVMDPKLPPAEFPRDLLTTGNAQEATVRLMNHIYGKQEPRHGCWMTKLEDLPFCMKIVQSEIKTVGGEKRLYAVATGQAIDDKGETMIAHAMQGLVGAFIVRETNGKAALMAQSTDIQTGTMGTAPSEWTLIELGANNNWGWQGEYSDCHQGQCGARMIILANQAGAVQQVGDDDTGACGDDDCAEKTSTLKSTVRVGNLPKEAAFFNLLVTVTGTSNGTVLESKTWTLPFDSAKRTYTAPADWPFADREF